MTQTELDAAIAELPIARAKPRSTGNSHRRKQWENRRHWRLCTVGTSCKQGSFKHYKAMQEIYDVSDHWTSGLGYLRSNGRLAHVYYDDARNHFKPYSYQNKYARNTAARHVRRYKGDIAVGGMYRKIFDYLQSCY